MTTPYRIRLLEASEIETIVPLLQLLDATLDPSTLSRRLSEMLAAGYQCAGIYDADQLIGIAGLWIRYKYYSGKHLEPDNVAIRPEYRGRGVGEQLMCWVDAYAQSLGCATATLNCYTTNHVATRFWLNQGYQIVSFHLLKKYPPAAT